MLGGTVMCGIVGYVGDKQAADFLLEGLAKLEYRGYDSAGIAVFDGSSVRVEKSVGRLASLRDKIRDDMPQGTMGIGHTRWATHGRPSDVNAHPHTDCSGDFVVVHNGIIENYLSLKEDLIEKGHAFRSETDTEVVAHLLEEVYNGDFLITAVRDDCDALSLEKSTITGRAVADAAPEKIIFSFEALLLHHTCSQYHRICLVDYAILCGLYRKIISHRIDEACTLLRDGDSHLVYM